MDLPLHSEVDGLDVVDGKSNTAEKWEELPRVSAEVVEKSEELLLETAEFHRVVSHEHSPQERPHYGPFMARLQANLLFNNYAYGKFHETEDLALLKEYLRVNNHNYNVRMNTEYKNKKRARWRFRWKKRTKLKDPEEQTTPGPLMSVENVDETNSIHIIQPPQLQDSNYRLNLSKTATYWLYLKFLFRHQQFPSVPLEKPPKPLPLLKELVQCEFIHLRYMASKYSIHTPERDVT